MIINLTESIRREVERNNIEKSFQLTFKLRSHLQQLGYYNYSDRLISFNNQYHQLKNSFHEGLLNHEEYEISRNKIIWNLIKLLNEIESDPEIKSQIEINIALAQTEEAIQKLLNLTKGTEIYNEALLLSSRFYNLKKDSQQRKKPSLTNKILKPIINKIGEIFRKFT